MKAVFIVMQLQKCPELLNLDIISVLLIVNQIGIVPPVFIEPTPAFARMGSNASLLGLSKLPLIGYYLVLLATAGLLVTLCVQRGVVGLENTDTFGQKICL